MFGLDLNPTDWWNQNRIIAAGLIFAWCQISLVLFRIWSTIQPKAKILLRLHKVISHTCIWKWGWVLIHLYSWKRLNNSIAKLLCMLWSWTVSNRLIYAEVNLQANGVVEKKLLTGPRTKWCIIYKSIE